MTSVMSAILWWHLNQIFNQFKTTFFIKTIKKKVRSDFEFVIFKIEDESFSFETFISVISLLEPQAN